MVFMNFGLIVPSGKIDFVVRISLRFCDCCFNLLSMVFMSFGLIVPSGKIDLVVRISLHFRDCCFNSSLFRCAKCEGLKNTQLSLLN